MLLNAYKLWYTLELLLYSVVNTSIDFTFEYSENSIEH